MILITMVACHGASADHFSLFAEKLLLEGYTVQVFASEHAQKKFQDRNIPIYRSFKTEDGNALEIVLDCNGSVVLTDVGHPFAISLQKTLASKAPEVLRLAYYDRRVLCGRNRSDEGRRSRPICQCQPQEQSLDRSPSRNAGRTWLLSDSPS